MNQKSFLTLSEQSKSKGFAPILILMGIMVIVLSVGGYLLYQRQVKPAPVLQPVVQPTSVPAISPVASSSTETANPDLIGANWKTYNSVNHRFSMKYPTSLIAKDLRETSTPAWESVRFYPSEADMSLPTYVVSYETANTVGKQFRDIQTLAPGEKLFVNDTDYFVKIRNMTIGSYPSIEYIYDATGPYKGGRGSSYSHILNVNKNGALLMFSSMRGSEEEQQKWDPIFIRIIETIKFY